MLQLAPKLRLLMLFVSITAGDRTTLDGEGDTAGSNTEGGESGNSSKESHYYNRGMFEKGGVDERRS